MAENKKTKTTAKKTEAELKVIQQEKKKKELENAWKINLLDSIESRSFADFEFNLFPLDIDKLLKEPLEKDGSPAIFQLIEDRQCTDNKCPQFDYLLENHLGLIDSHIEIEVKGEELKVNPFQYAVYLNKWALAKKIYEKRNSIIDSVDIKNNNSTLNILALNGDKKGLLFLLENNKFSDKATVDLQNSKERTALLLAYGEKLKYSKKGNKKEVEKYQQIVDLLLKHGSSIIKDDHKGQFVLSLASKYEPDYAKHLSRTAPIEHLEHSDGKGNAYIHNLIKYGKDDHELENVTRRFNTSNSNAINHANKDGDTPLHLAVEQDSPKNLGILLDNHQGISYSEKNDKGDSVFHQVNRNGDSHKFNLLIKGNTGEGIQSLEHSNKLKEGINLGNRKEETPISLAIRQGNKQLIEQDIKAGAQLNSNMDGTGEPLLTYAINHCNKTEKEGHNKNKCNLDIAEILLKNGANVNIRTSSHPNPPLIDAVHNHNVKGVKLLLKFNPDLKLKDSEGRTALHIAVHRFSHPERAISYKEDYHQIIDLLIKQDKLDEFINIKDNKSNTPLYSLVKHTKRPEDSKDPHHEIDKSTKLVKTLLKNGAHTRFKNNDDKTALDLANNEKVRKSILDHQKDHPVKEPRGFLSTDSDVSSVESRHHSYKDTSDIHKVYKDKTKAADKCKKVVPVYKCDNNGNSSNQSESFKGTFSDDELSSNYNEPSYSSRSKGIRGRRGSRDDTFSSESNRSSYSIPSYSSGRREMPIYYRRNFN